MMIGPILGGAALARFDPAKTKIIAVGNSIIYGQGATDRATLCWVKLIEKLEPLLSKGATVLNNGVGGNTISAPKPGYGSMMGRLATDLAALDVSKLNIVLCGEFTNEVGAAMVATGTSANGVAAHDAWKAYFAAFRAGAKAKGARVLMITVTTIPGGAPANADAAALAYALDINENGYKVANNLMRATWRSYADGIIDIAALPVFATLFANGIYTSAALGATGLYRQYGGLYDGYHPGDAGYAYMVTAAPAVLKKLRSRSRLG
jgi:lysophospholipase L1-like esterase